MSLNKNSDRFYANMNEMKRGHAHYDGSKHEKLTREQKRERRIKQHSAREEWRNYGAGRASYFSVIFTETLVSVFAIAFYSLFVVTFVVGFIALMISNEIMTVLMGGGIIAALITPHTRRLVKRWNFTRKLARGCKKNGWRFYRYRNALMSLYRPSGAPDFAVETRDTVYECMYYPAPRRLSILRFDKPGEVCVVTGILKNRFKDVLGMHEHVKVKPFGFEPVTKSTTKNVKKVVLLNPVPYELYYYDKKDGKTVQGGSGTEFFEYTAYSGSGFINTLMLGI
ncbi:MAG: hypothetical protein IJY27_06515 [Clostridia bacterium]|nr:hypothetical protein [Clostridia bacterium]